MISYEQPKLWQRPWVMALTLGALVALLSAWWTTEGESAPSQEAPVQVNTVVRSDIGLPDPAHVLTASLRPSGQRFDPPRQTKRSPSVSLPAWSAICASRKALHNGSAFRTLPMWPRATDWQSSC